MKTLALVECINARLQKYRVRWDVQPYTDEQHPENDSTVTFVEAEFGHKPTAAEVEAAIAGSGIDIMQAELDIIAGLLGYEKAEFDREYLSGREARIQSDPTAQLMEAVKEMRLARTDIGNAEALRLPHTFVSFEELCRRGEQVQKGVVLRYGNQVWRVVQAHTPMDIYPPSVDTAALYTKIEPEHAGTEDDPIPYAPPMLIYNGKYYTQGGVKYKCTRDSGIPLEHDLSALVGHYVVEV